MRNIEIVEMLREMLVAGTAGGNEDFIGFGIKAGN